MQVLQTMPADARYRTATEQLTQERLAAVQTVRGGPRFRPMMPPPLPPGEGVALLVAHPSARQGKDEDAIEAVVKMGQVEELIVQAQDELALAQKMRDWAPWQTLTEVPPAGQWKFP